MPRLALAVLVLAAAGPAAGRPAADPLALELARMRAVLGGASSGDETLAQIKAGVEPALKTAEDALAAGRRLLALERLARAKTNVAAALYVRGRPASERRDGKAFEARWRREKRDLERRLRGAPTTVAALRPSAVRALAEMALVQAPIHLEASLEYARATEAEAGLFYVGAARAQLAVVELCRAEAASTTGREPELRSLDVELAALEGDLVRAYKPPASIDRHTDFILASSVLNEARELDAAGMRRGALLRTLQAADRVARLRPPAAPSDVAARLAEHERRLAAPEVDHSIGRLVLETAQTAPPEQAAIIAGDVLPRYFAALEPARPAAPAKPEVTVTLVRWPFT
jgi:hypothetical protein